MASPMEYKSVDLTDNNWVRNLARHSVYCSDNLMDFYLAFRWVCHLVAHLVVHLALCLVHLTADHLASGLAFRMGNQMVCWWVER